MAKPRYQPPADPADFRRLFTELFKQEPVVLASGSTIRRLLLENAGVAVTVTPARVDEDALRAALAAEGCSARDMADALAEAKARKVSGRSGSHITLGCDQILEHQGQIYTKADTKEGLRGQLLSLRGKTHLLWSAAVLYRDGQPLWRALDSAKMTMADFSDAYLDSYISRHGDLLLETVGGYMLEGEGSRLFSAIEGSYFTILGLPLLPVLQQLARMEVIES